MRVEEYAAEDGVGLASLIARGEISASEAALAAREAMARVNPSINAVIETYDDRIDGAGNTSFSGPFAGVPFLIKDVTGHEAGRKIEYGSRLCAGMVSKADSHFAELLRKAGLNIIGRTNTPEYSIATSSENKLYGATSTPWRQDFSAGGSTGGGAAAVAAGIVPLAHGSDIGGSIRIPASWCGGVGLKPSRGRISSGPWLDESGWGLAMSFVQTRTMRDAAHMLDALAIPQPGDPFVVAKPSEPYAAYLSKPLARLRIAWCAKPLMDAPVDPEVAAAVEAAAKSLAGMGHEVEAADFPFDAATAAREMAHHWFFGFHLWIDGLAKRNGRAVGPDTLEPATLAIYEHARAMDPYRFLDAHAWLNGARREIGRFFTRYDVLVSPTTAQVSQPHGLYGLDLPGMDAVEAMLHLEKPVQYCFPYNVAGAPALSLPLALHSNGLPIGVQLGARPAEEHLLIGLGAALEQAMPWRDRIPPLHVSRIDRA